MRKIVFTEKFCSPENLFPFTLTRQMQDIRIGILTIREKWEQYLGFPSFDKQEDDYKDIDRAIVIDENIGRDVIYLVHGNLLPTAKISRQVKKLKPGEFLSLPDKENFVYCISKKQVIDEYKIKAQKAIKWSDDLKEICHPWDILKINGWAIQQDFKFLVHQKKGQTIPTTNKVING